jgi:hypothetical protein
VTAALIVFGLLVMGVVATLADRWWNQYIRDTQHGPAVKWQGEEVVDGNTTLEFRQLSANQTEALIIVHTHNECYVAAHGGDGFVCIACTEWLVEA